MPLNHKINIKWNLGFCTNLLESFSSGNQIPFEKIGKLKNKTKRNYLITFLLA